MEKKRWFIITLLITSSNVDCGTYTRTHTHTDTLIIDVCTVYIRERVRGTFITNHSGNLSQMPVTLNFPSPAPAAAAWSFKRRFTAVSFNYTECALCSPLQQKPIPTTERLPPSGFGTNKKNNNNNNNSEKEINNHKRRNDFVLRHTSLNKDSTFFETVLWKRAETLKESAQLNAFDLSKGKKKSQKPTGLQSSRRGQFKTSVHSSPTISGTLTSKVESGSYYVLLLPNQDGCQASKVYDNCDSLRHLIYSSWHSAVGNHKWTAVRFFGGWRSLTQRQFVVTHQKLVFNYPRRQIDLRLFDIHSDRWLEKKELQWPADGPERNQIAEAAAIMKKVLEINQKMGMHFQLVGIILPELAHSP